MHHFFPLLYTQKGLSHKVFYALRIPCLKFDVTSAFMLEYSMIFTKNEVSYAKENICRAAWPYDGSVPVLGRLSTTSEWLPRRPLQEFHRRDRGLEMAQRRRNGDAEEGKGSQKKPAIIQSSCTVCPAPSRRGTGFRHLYRWLVPAQSRWARRLGRRRPQCRYRRSDGAV